MSKAGWTIGIFTGTTPFDLSQPSEIANPVLTAEDVTDLDVDIVAHPFLIPADSNYWLFFTAKHGDAGYSGIGLAESRDGLKWKYRKIVLREPHILAYPHIIPWRGEHYMLPETYDQPHLRLYKATRFPFEWKPQCDLLKGGAFISSSIVRRQESWWMFVGGLDNATLRLFFADDLTGPWTEHPKSPIIANDLHTARPAGRPVVIDGTIYRFGQDCLPTYGRRVFAFRVTEISRTKYAETMIPQPVISATSQGWNADAMHHVDAHEISPGRWIAAVDANGTRV